MMSTAHARPKALAETITLTTARTASHSTLWIGRGLLKHCNELLPLAAASKVCIVADRGVGEIAAKVQASIGLSPAQICFIEGGETSKTAQGLVHLWEFFAKQQLDRKSLIVSIGGGATSDVVGFAASTFMRGVSVVNVPTTLLAQVDASVGGKTGINLGETKNLIGTVQQPVGVIIDIDTLATLPKRDLTSGFAEIVKHGLIADREYFFRSISKHSAEWSPEELVELVRRSCHIKREVVESDESERGPRKTLNFGHTIGHAVEAVSHTTETPLTHGEAVAIGMVGESLLSHLVGNISREDYDTIVRGIAAVGLPTRLPFPLSRDALYDTMLRDKKNTQGTLKWSLLERVGLATFDVEVSPQLLEQALTAIEPSGSHKGLQKMHALTLSPSNASIHASVTVPGSKSYTNRALLLSSLADGVSRLSSVAMSSDSEAMVGALEQLGVSVLPTPDGEAPGLIVQGCGGRLKPLHGVIDVGPAGTTMRFLTALCASIPGADITLQGSARMHERPIRELVTALTTSGADVQYLGRDGCPPLRITTRRALDGGEVIVDGSISSQFISALLLTAVLRHEALTIRIAGEQTSQSYIDMTLQSLREFGVSVVNDGYRSYHIAAEQRVNPIHYTVEGDASGASYLWGLAAVSGGSVTVHNVNPKSAQGDIVFPDILERMGCRVEKGARSITVTAPPQLTAVDVDMSNMPDTAQTLAVIAACAKGSTTIRGLHTLRIKETDRIAALHSELAKVGIASDAGADFITVHGGNPTHARIKTYDDHRMAMSFALLGARPAGITIEEPAVVNKSFSSFWSTVGTMGIAQRPA